MNRIFALSVAIAIACFASTAFGQQAFTLEKPQVSAHAAGGIYMGDYVDVNPYGFGLGAGGPAVMLWGWAGVGLFVLCVGLALAEVTSAYPTSGALYYMADRLGGRRWGWYTGWLNLLGLLGAIFLMVVFGGVAGLVQADGDPQRRLRPPDAGDVVEVRVGQQDIAHLEPVRLHGVQQLVDLVTRIDHDRVAGLGAADDVAVLVEGVDGADLENHREPSSGSFSHYGMR